MTKTEQNFNPGLALIDLPGTGPWWKARLLDLWIVSYIDKQYIHLQFLIMTAARAAVVILRVLLINMSFPSKTVNLKYDQVQNLLCESECHLHDN